MKKNAWTMAEMTIAIIIVMILCALSMTLIKNTNINKARIFLYVALKNLSAGHAAIMQMGENNGIFYPDTASASDGDATVLDDWYCIQMADIFSTVETVDCKKNASNSAVNFVAANGVSHQGMSSAWKLAYSSLYYKNIVLDINYEEGPNKIGVDRFPFRIFRGPAQNGIDMSGLIYPVNCANDVIAGENNTVVTLTTPYCKDGFDAGGSSKAYDLSNDGEIVSYNIYRATDEKTPKKAHVVIGSLSTFAADCQAYAGMGFYSKKQCFDAGYKLSPKCAHADVCTGCAAEYNVCPNGITEQQCLDMADTYMMKVPNEEDPSVIEDVSPPCIILPAKPTGGLGMVGGLLVGEMGL